VVTEEVTEVAVDTCITCITCITWWCEVKEATVEVVEQIVSSRGLQFQFHAYFTDPPG
jgi:hypothetical protein